MSDTWKVMDLRPMVVRLKVKHVLALLLAVVLVPLAFSYGTDTVLLYAARRAWSNGRQLDALALYDRLLRRCDDCPAAEEALYRTATYLGPRDDFYSYSYVFNDNLNRGTVGAQPAEMMKTAEERLAKLLAHFPDSKWSAEAAERLVDIHIELGDWEKAERVLQTELATVAVVLALVAGVYWFEWLWIDEATRSLYSAFEESMAQAMFLLTEAI